MTYPISDVTRRVVYSGSAGVGPYSFSFEILDQTDIAVYLNTTLLTLTSNYTVSIGGAGTGSVTLVTPATGSDTVTLVGNRAIERTTDFVTGGDLFANTLNDELDSLTIFAQQVKETADRGLKAPVTDPTGINMELPIKANRLGKVLAFDGTTGDPVAGPSLTSVTTVAAQSANINTVAGIAADVSTVAGISGNVTTVAGISSNVTTVAGINANVTTVAGISADVTTVAGIAANVTTVAGVAASVPPVAVIDTEIVALAGLTTEISALYAELGDIATKVSKTGDTGSAVLPSGTEAQRDGSPVAGYIRFNTDVAKFEGYNGTVWSSVGGGATGGGSDAVFIENDQTVTANYTIPATKNAMSTGPVTVNSGVTVTVSSGARYVVI